LKVHKQHIRVQTIINIVYNPKKLFLRIMEHSCRWRKSSAHFCIGVGMLCFFI